MARLVMMLSPPRSFSSLVSTMIGQHPQIYGFPELQLVVRATLRDVMAWEHNREKYLGSPGLLRSFAELEFGGQTSENVLKAANWLQDRMDWSSADVMNYIMDKAEEVAGTPFCLEKSPNVTWVPRALEGMRQNWPDALYIHVTRHPVNLKKSIDEFIINNPRFDEEQRKIRLDHALLPWPISQRNILDFAKTLAPGQYLRIRGEDVLGDAFNMMHQVAEFLELRTDDDAINAMLRPEESPYACLGPPNAAYGNDPKFILSPKFRPGRPSTASLEEFLDVGEGAYYNSARKTYLKQIANCLGYY